MQITTDLKKCLNNISFVLQRECDSVKSIGIGGGKIEIVIFLLLYARYTKNEKLRLKGEKLFIQIFDEINKNTPVCYFNGLVGIGIAVEYLVKHQLIEVDTNELLEELDLVLLQWKNHYSDIRMLELIGYCRYFIMRLTNSNSAFTEKGCLLQLINNIGKSCYSLEHAISILDITTDILLLELSYINEPQSYLNSTIDKIQKGLPEQNNFRPFNPLIVSMELIQTYEKLTEEKYMINAVFLLNKYEKSFREYLSLDIDGLFSGGFKWSVLYHYLSHKLKNEEYLNLSEEWLIYSIQKYDDIFTGEYQNRISLNDWNGFAQIGLALLYLIGECPEDIFDVFPLYLS